MKLGLVTAAAFAGVLLAGSASAADFSYEPPGALVTGSGTGRADSNVYAPGMRFPMEVGEAYANSQVYNPGGGEVGGDQCSAKNYAYPWRDNYCEKRSWSMPLCPSGTGHQGQDIRAATCEKDKYWVVAAVDGTITNVGVYSVYLTAADGTRYDYLHMSNVQVTTGTKVVRGQRIGKVSNQFGGTPTTVHLHMNIRQNVSGLGAVYVPPYTSLVKAYEEHLGISSPEGDGPVPGFVRTPPNADTATSTSPTEPDERETTSATVELDASGEVAVDAGCSTSQAGHVPAAGVFGLGLGLASLVAARRRRR